jgi:ATP synthase protein I
MSQSDKSGGADDGRGAPASDADLSARLRQLDARLSDIKTQSDASARPNPLSRDGTAMAKGLRLVSEFVAGIAAGGLMGWTIDWVFDSQPFVLMVGLMFGFAAGLRNLYRATQTPSVPPR